VDLKVHDSSVFHSLDNLDGLSGPSPMDTRKWNMNLNITNLSLDTMLSQTEFHSLNMEEKHRAVMRLVPLLKPYICSIVDKLVGLDYTLGAANQHLDQVDDRPPQYHTLQGDMSAPPPVIYTDPVHQLCSPVHHHLASTDSRIAPPTFKQIIQSKLLHRRVKLNVGGVRHEVMWKMLEQIPNSRLGRLCSANTHGEILDLCSDYSIEDNEYFFDRHPRSFNTILNFYRTGKLHVADEMCVLSFNDDLDYWGIPDYYLETCCTFKFSTRKEHVEEEMEAEASKLILDEVEDFGEGKFVIYQKFLWDLLEKPDTSMAAKAMSSISMLFVVISTIGMILNTMPAFQHFDLNDKPIDNPELALVESVCISWFTLEYLLRFAGSPGKFEFLVDGMNVVDVLAIMPYYVSLFLLNDAAITPPEDGMFQQKTQEPEDDGSSVEGILQVFRIFKLARIFKLGRHSPGLQSIVHTIRQSLRELGLMLMLILIAGLTFASLCYFVEEEEDSGFTSIPTGIYWVVITMTTVGYGDIFPTTPLGKLVGSMCAISGVLVMSLPIPIIAGNFEKFHKTQHKKNKLLRRRAATVAARIKEEKERISDICGTSTELLTPHPKIKSPVVSLLTTKTWSSRRNSGVGDHHPSRHSSLR